MNHNLYEEISDKNAEKIIGGGSRYTFTNQLNSDITFYVTTIFENTAERTLAPGDTTDIDVLDSGEGLTVEFDSIVGPPGSFAIQALARAKACPGLSTFNLNPDGTIIQLNSNNSC